MNLDRRAFIKGLGATVAGAGVTAADTAYADMRIEEVPSGEAVPEIKLTEEQKRIAERAYVKAEKMGTDYFDYEDTEANELTLDKAATPEMQVAFAAIVFGILSGLRRSQQSEALHEDKQWGVTMWKPVDVAGAKVKTMGVAHIDKTLRKSFPRILREIKKHDIIILESVQGGKILQKTRDALVADPSILEYPETFADWRKRTGTKGFFDLVACSALALNQRVFVTDPSGDHIGTLMFLADMGAAYTGAQLVARDVRLTQSTIGIPVLLTMLSNLKNSGEIGAEIATKIFSKRMRECTPQQFARLLWDVNDWRDIHAAADTRQLIETGIVPAGEEALLIRGAAHGPSVARYLSEPREARIKRLAYPHWEMIRAISDFIARMTMKDPNTYSFELMPDLTRREFPK